MVRVGNDRICLKCRGVKGERERGGRGEGEEGSLRYLEQKEKNRTGPFRVVWGEAKERKTGRKAGLRLFRRIGA